ncbi:MAG: hypothetical protein K2X35_10420 [Bryobacteraceae bacterium]|nr:hypothetical protein [Bryobacteraceae bacterium]
MSEALDLVWRRADVQGHVISQAELAVWPSGDRETIIDLGLIRRTTDATALICEDCGEPHSAEIVRDARRPELPYYLCPRIGRVPVAEEATHQWEVDFDGLAALIRKALGLGGKASMLTPSRIWLLGRQQHAGGFWELFLVRGICWPDGVGLLDQCLRLQQSPAPVLLAPRRVPSAEILGKRSWAIRSLSEVASIDESKLAMDDQVLIAAGATVLLGASSSRSGSTAKRLPRSIGTPEAVAAAIKYMESKGLTETQFGNQFQSTDRTVRSFRKSGKMRRSTFEAMAKSMGLTIEELLRGELAKSDRR